jgi:hypothetical protein
MHAARDVDAPIRPKKWNACALFLTFVCTLFNLIALVSDERVPVVSVAGICATLCGTRPWKAVISLDMTSLFHIPLYRCIVSMRNYVILLSGHPLVLPLWRL